MNLSRCRRAAICRSTPRVPPPPLSSTSLSSSRPYTIATHDLTRPVQSYLSRSHDPYLNLSIEHLLLTKSCPTSTVLFLYVNRPCVVIGRNQNPWTEVNLPLLGRFESAPPLYSHGGGGGQVTDNRLGAQSGAAGPLELVRRRSGGGTVFHDFGNVNWTVICPASSFTRDKHAEMVVRALRGRGIKGCRVNERHDIVLDTPEGRQTEAGLQEVAWGAEDDAHATPWMDGSVTKKVSGSAYKLTRGRALHHGTALLGSGNLGRIKEVLTAPGREFIRSKGVESVSSPVTNLGLANGDFIEGVGQEFTRMYGHAQEDVVGEEWLEDQELRKGWTELKSPDWTYCQTPRFELGNGVSADKGGDNTLSLVLEARSGSVESLVVREADETRTPSSELKDDSARYKIHEMHDWTNVFNAWEGSTGRTLGLDRKAGLASWVRDKLPTA